MASNGNFFWYDLMTSDVPAALKFYEAVVGWSSTPFPGNDAGYTVLMAGAEGVGGVMACPEGSQPTAWIGYIKSADVDAGVRAAVGAGGSILHGPVDIPGDVGRFATIADPNGAAYNIMAPNGPEADRPAVSMETGRVGWNEYMGKDPDKAFDYYSSLYGWTKSTAMDMGEMGVYQLVAKDGEDIGAMMGLTPQTPASFWGFYFAVNGIDAARQRIVDNGGAVLMEPMEVPGGAWAMFARDPQGGHFGLVSGTK